MPVKKSRTKRLFRIVFVILAFLYLFTRLYNLTLLPIFFDEANYIFWAKQIAATNEHWFISLAGGKPFPLIWIIALFLKVVPLSDYLLAGRLPSVIFGAVTLLGIYHLAKLTTGSVRTALLAALLYVILPFSLLHDRLALYDSQLSAMLTWALYFFFKTLQSLKASDAVWWGVFLGLALHAKASALALAFLTPLLYLFLALRTKRFNLKRILSLVALAIVTSQLIANVNVISTGYTDYLVKSLDYAPAGGISISPVREHFFPNLVLSWEWLRDYFTLPLFVFTLISLVFFCRERKAAGFVFLTLSVVPIVIFSYLGRIFFPRYFVFIVPYLLIPLAYLLHSLHRRHQLLMIGVAICILYLPLKFDYLMLVRFESAPLPAIDNWQYISGTPSGYGLNTVYTYLNNLAATEKITVYIESDYYGNLYNATALYFYDQPNLMIIRLWPPNAIKPSIFPSYFLTQEDDPHPWALVATGLRPGGERPIRLFKLEP